MSEASVAGGSDAGDLTENFVPHSLEQPEGPGRPQPIVRAGRGRTLNDNRYLLALCSVALLALLGIGSLLLLWALPKERFDALREILPLIYTPIVALVSTSFAWFFATEAERSGRSSRRGNDGRD